MGSVTPFVRWATAGRPMPGQSVSGDAHRVEEGAELLFAAVLDGLGHGADAHAAAAAVGEGLGDPLSEPLLAIFDRAHAAAVGTRGVAMSAAHVSREGTLTWGGVGNVEGVLLRADSRRERLLLQGGVIGQRMPRSLRVASLPLVPGDVLAMATDGLSPRFTDQPVLRSGRPVDEIAAVLLESCGRPRDDALVWVGRYLET